MISNQVNPLFPVLFRTEDRQQVFFVDITHLCVYDAEGQRAVLVEREILEGCKIKPVVPTPTGVHEIIEQAKNQSAEKRKQYS